MKILLIAYDNDAHISCFPQGIAYIASALRKAGHDITIYNQDVYHYADNDLTGYLNKYKFDVVGLGACGGYWQYKKVLAISEAINKAVNRPLYVLGGHLPSPCPEYMLKKTGADVVVIGEGEETIVELLSKPLTIPYVDGVVVKGCDPTPERKPIKEIDSIPFPAYDLFPIDHYALFRGVNIKPNQRYMPVLSGRGCTFKCNFCYRMDKGFRPRSPESIIEEIKLLKDFYDISYIDFSDELLMSSPKRTIELNEAFIKAELNINYSCNGRLNYATPEVLKVMKSAGCVFINYGIESIDDEALARMNKHLTVSQIIKGVEATIAEGISPGLNIIWGNIGETKEILDKDVEFLLKYDDQAQLRTIRPVTPYPGSPLFDYAIEKGLLSGIEDFYENKHKNSDLLAVNFTDIPDDEFHRLLKDANLKLINHYYRQKWHKAYKMTNDLYDNKNVKFRGYR
jgi:radical SAM superfamily enzyme YgiQ (UPF0313 family)